METSLEAEIEKYLAAKADEESARERRYAAEVSIASLVGSKSEGQTTTNTDRFKVVAKYKINRTLDAKVWAKIAPELDPTIALHLVKFKPELDLKGYRWCEGNPEVFAIVSKAVTSRPAKVSLTITEIKNGI